MKRILVIEDDLLMIHVVELIIKKEGHLADLAYNGKEAAMLLGSYDYDLVIADLKLPFPDLDELSAQLRAQRGRRGLPVIMILPASFVMDSISSWFGMEAEEIIIRPFSPLELTTKIQALLN
ncbi:response regulator transcription factor [Chitinophaga rhizosphaerae]|uniref:response regulator transcription factor n=1 Tax=Chitinophaga rhizosphaerae TaxID=1864947 RepID=UPI000F7FE672|nr:response regulator [Chitinophaga rhizosphaerae]